MYLQGYASALRHLPDKQGGKAAVGLASLLLLLVVVLCGLRCRTPYLAAADRGDDR